MANIVSKIILGSAVFITMSACSGEPVKIRDGQYWQRSSVSESVYMRGPKAQQMLTRDIARCVTELRELERLGQIKNAIPTDYNGRVLDPDELALYEWDSPERDGNLFAEHGNYQDFHACMLAKGWERIKYVPYEVEQRAQANYYATHVDYKDKPYERPRKKKPTRNTEGDFGELNN